MGLVKRSIKHTHLSTGSTLHKPDHCACPISRHLSTHQSNCAENVVRYTWANIIAPAELQASPVGCNSHAGRQQLRGHKTTTCVMLSMWALALIVGDKLLRSELLNFLSWLRIYVPCLHICQKKSVFVWTIRRWFVWTYKFNHSTAHTWYILYGHTYLIILLLTLSINCMDIQVTHSAAHT